MTAFVVMFGDVLINPELITDIAITSATKDDIISFICKISFMRGKINSYWQNTYKTRIEAEDALYKCRKIMERAGYEIVE